MSNTDSIAEQLTKLAALKDAGHITADEFEAQKRLILDAAARPKPTQATHNPGAPPPGPAPAKENKGCLNFALFIGGAIALICVLSQCGKASAPSQTSSGDQASRQAEAAYQATSRDAVATWSYGQSSDDMTSKRVNTATLASVTDLNFSSPYSGQQKAVLTLRKHPRYGSNAILQIDRGQFICSSYDGCNITVRFDDQPAKTFHANGPDDSSSTIIFISNYPAFYRSLKASKKVTIAATFYQEGTPSIEFDTSKFEEKKYLP